jgi:hypothetical protein
LKKKKKKGDSGSVLSGRVINNIAGSQVKKKVRKDKIKKSTKKKKIRAEKLGEMQNGKYRTPKGEIRERANNYHQKSQ